jgi:glycosyltransferase involved in cell wall biosynthesis
MNSVCILIPAYHEELKIGEVVESASKYGEVVVVDDGSLDQTFHVAKRYGAHVIRHPINQGKGAAIQTGLNYFLKGSWEGLILMDGDGQHDPHEIPRFIEACQDKSVMMMIGNRMHKAHKMPRIRKLTNWLMSKILSIVAGISVKDSQCGFRLLRRDLVQRINLKSTKFEIESEILIEAARFTKGILSVPVSSIYGDEKSKIRPVQDTLRFFRFMIRVSRRFRQNNSLESASVETSGGF